MSDIYIPCCTDNQGNTLAIMNEKTKTWPNAGLMMQLAWTLQAKGCRVNMEYTRRNINQWADALAGGKTEGFNRAMRCRLDLSNKKWPLLFKMATVVSECESHRKGRQ